MKVAMLSIVSVLLCVGIWTHSTIVVMAHEKSTESIASEVAFGWIAGSLALLVMLFIVCAVATATAFDPLQIKKVLEAEKETPEGEKSEKR